MHTIKLTLLFILFYHIAVGQTTVIDDTLSVSDTIFLNRTVERVVYVFSAPEQYLSIGARALVSAPRFTGYDGASEAHLAYAGVATVQYQKKKWIVTAGVGMQRFSRTAEYSAQKYTVSRSTYEHIDTLSYYLVQNSNETHREYITESAIRDTVLISSETVQIATAPHYSYVQFPLSVGRELRHGFLCVDAYAGLVPALLVQSSNEMYSYSETHNVVPESRLLRRFICDANASISVRYLLTFSTFISAGVYCTVPLLPMYSTTAEKSLRKYEAGMSLSFSYILFEGK